MHSIKGISWQNSAAIVKQYRNRLGMTQKTLATHLGYQSASMIHHFEKQIREPSLEDFIVLMILAEDNVRGFIFALTHDKSYSQQFPEGTEVSKQSWQVYWSNFYISAIRQLMRSNAYQNITTYRTGMFAQVVEKIRNLQEDVHNIPLEETDGFIYLGWHANYWSMGNN